MAIITGTAGNDTITNTVSSFGPLTSIGNDSVLGEGGNDSIQGGSGLDTLRGGDGLDNLQGGNDNDFLFGDEGDDVLVGGAGDDLMDGGGGFDVVTFSGGGAVSVTVNNVAGVNTGISAPAPLVVNQGADSFINFEQVNGSGFDDTITIASVNTTLGFNVRGNGGNDRLTGTTDANISLILDYRSTDVTSGVSVDLAAGRATDGFGGIDTIANFVAVRGTDLTDSLFGAGTNDRFRGRGGNDYLDGRAGNDVADYGQAANAVSVNLLTGRAEDGEGGTDTLVSIEEVWGSIGNDTLIGSGADETFAAFSGSDTISGGGGQDRVGYHFTSGLTPPITQGAVVNLVTGVATDAWGGTDSLSGIERVTGSLLADSILGGAESNRFRGRAGNDTLDGGLGGDYAEFQNATIGATVNLTTGIATDGEGGTDSLISIENAIGGNFADRLTGVAQLGRSTSDLRGGGGNDTLVGISGQYVRADYADQTVGLSINLASGTVNDGRGGTDTLVTIRGVTLFGDFADTVVGAAFNEWISPSEGADSVNAGGGVDIIGYGGVDVGGVSVNLTTARAIDTGGATDTILGFEGVATSFGDDTITGSALGNLIGPGAGVDFVNALGGQDTISYTLGFSPDGVQFSFNEAGDRQAVQGVTVDLFTSRATDFGGSIDTIIGFENAIGGTGADIIRGGVGANILVGAEGNDTIEGRAGDDTLDGGAGVDRLVGGLDDDTYILDDTPDVVFEAAANQGIDTILTTRATLVMAANVENLVATNAIAHSFIGNGLANAITGNANADTLNGGIGDDTLDGGAGIDSLVGGLDDDTYILDDTLDIVFEAAANQGIDTILTTRATLVMASNVENLLATNAIAHSFTGNGLANAITGNAGADTLNGGSGSGNDTLDGGAGIDSLVGGAGADQYILTAGDVVFEAPNQGLDTVFVTEGTAYTLGANLEALVLVGAALTTGAGNGLANTIIGNDAANLLQGLGGDDVLDGGIGNDTLVGGLNGDSMTGGDGADRFRFTTANDSPVSDTDVILDFTFSAALGIDRIDLALIDANNQVANNQAFGWIGNAAFAGGGAAGAGKLRYEVLNTDYYAIQGDVNGDGAADFSINVISSFTPTAGWMFL
jgi:Ca2+-binding RTX toxin-like protein